MTAENKFTSIMQQRTDAELIEIINRLRDDYQKEAVEAAEAELKYRNLTPDKLEEAEQRLGQKLEKSEQNANEPLDIHWKILCLLFPGLFNFFIAFIFKGEEKNRKFKEAWKWTFYGFGLYGGLVFLMSMLFGR